MPKKIIYTLFLLVIFLFSKNIWARIYKPEPVNPDNLIHIVPTTSQQTLFIVDNRLVQTKVLLDKIGTLPNKKISQFKALDVAKRIKQYYIDLGFVLANVKLEETNNSWILHIDEGKLDNISIYGLGWYDTTQFRSRVLPQNVFNVITLNRELQMMLSGKFNEATYELVEVGQRPPNVFSKVTVKMGEALTEHKQLRLDSENKRYGLNIYLHVKRRYGTLRPSLTFSSDYGIQLINEYEKESLIIKNDNIYTRLGLGLNRHQSIDPAKKNNIYYPNVTGEVKWFTPPFKDEKFRFYLDVLADYMTDQRVDLPLDKYGYAEVRSAPVFEYQFAKNKFINFAAGYEFIRVDLQRLVPTDPFTPQRTVDNAVYGNAGVDLLFGKPVLIHDFNHKLEANYYFYYRGKNNNLSEIIAKYQKVFFAKLLEMHIKASGIGLFGDIQFYDEYYLRELYFHSSFGRKYFIRRGGSLSLESRFNVRGNKVQIGVFDDVAVFQHFLEKTTSDKILFGNSLGVGTYFLFYDAFQAYFNYAFGYNTNKETSHDIMFGVRKLF